MSSGRRAGAPAPGGHREPRAAPPARSRSWPRDLRILNSSETPPFQLDEHADVSEELRLRYRYLDLRRPEMQERLRLR